MKTYILLLLTCSFLYPFPDHDQLDFREYQYPISQLDQEIVFVYQKTDSKDSALSYTYKQVISLDGKQALASTQGNGVINYDSAITELDNSFRLLKIYRFDYDSLNNHIGTTQGQIKKFEISDSDIHAKLRFVKDNIVIKTDKTTEFVSDTTVSWKSEIVDAIYFESDYQVRVKHKFIPFLGEKRSYPGYSIYAENIGLVRYGSEVNGQMFEWKLIEIKKTEGNNK